MKKIAGMTLAFLFWASAIAPLSASQTDLGREVLGKNDGWAAYSTGTTGGSKASADQVFTVTNRQELVKALGGDNKTNGANDTPKIIYVRGTINLSVDDQNRPLGYNEYRDPAYTIEEYLKAYDPKTWGKKDVAGPLEEARARSQKNQAERVLINVGSNTTLVGLGNEAKIVGGGLLLTKVDNVIVRNIEFQDAYDYFPQWDPTDGAEGNWNSEYDNLSIVGSTHVWVDHCTFNDGERPDAFNETYYGREYQHHDGLLDAKGGADLITISYNHFSEHSKTNLIGSSDSATTDEGRLRITFHHNFYENIGERAPRVRFGQVHLYNNYYKSDGNEHYVYTWGIGKSSKIYAENNYFEMDPGFDPAKLIWLAKGTALYETGSYLNGAGKHHEVSIVDAYNANPANTTKVSKDVGWKPSLFDKIDPTQSVPAIVKAKAGAGKL
ncbi:pectate lyase family protein [Brevibacillus migulae]|uniref:pectate lyase family protein n=1 Tax=Brevibacillus migulae TaxID=1644114 RepID=UPI00106E0FE4